MRFLNLIVIMALFFQSCKENKTINQHPIKIKWDTLAVIPSPVKGQVQYGLSGLIAGVTDNCIVVAGGSNFKNKVPWEGGVKTYYNDLYVLKMGHHGASWSLITKMPFSLAYSASISANNSVYAIGGEDENGPSNRFFRIQVEGDSVEMEDLPPLPYQLASPGAALVDSIIYLAGGDNKAGNATEHFLAFNINEPEQGWVELPNLPEAMSHMVETSLFDGHEECIYLFGGRRKSGITSQFIKHIWKYSPSAKVWTLIGEMKLSGGIGFGLSAGTGLAYKNRYALLLGGDEGKIYNQTERYNDEIAHETNAKKRQELIDQKISSLSHHPGFSKDIFLYDVLTGSFSKLGEIPGKTQVTTNAFWWNNQIVIPGGEVRPGIRTAIISRGTITSK